MAEDSLQQEPAAQEPGFGALLREAREAAGYSLDEISNRTKISTGQLEALESETVRLLPEAVYVRAFIRDICRAIGADPAPIIAAYAARYGKPEPARSLFSVRQSDVPRRQMKKAVEFHPSSRRRGLWVFIAFAVIVALAAMGWAGWGRGLVAKLSGESLEAVQVTQPENSAAALVRPRSPSNAMPVTAAASESAKVILPPVAPAPSPEAAKPEAAKPAAPAPEAVPPEAAPSAEEGTVQIRAVGSSWVKLTDASGKVLMQGEFKGGNERSFTGKLPIRVVLGNSPVCAVTLNGKPVDLTAYSSGRVARFTLQ